MRSVFVLILSALLWAQSGPAPPKPEPKSEEVMVGAFDPDEDVVAANVMRANAEIVAFENQIKPLQDLIDNIRKQEEPKKAIMSQRIAELCRKAKVPEDAIKAGQCAPKPQLGKKDGKEVIEMIWTKPKSDK